MKENRRFCRNRKPIRGNRTGELRLERFHCTKSSGVTGRTVYAQRHRPLRGNGSGDRSDRSTCPPDRAGTVPVIGRSLNLSVIGPVIGHGDRSSSMGGSACFSLMFTAPGRTAVISFAGLTGVEIRSDLLTPRTAGAVGSAADPGG